MESEVLFGDDPESECSLASSWCTRDSSLVMRSLRSWTLSSVMGAMMAVVKDIKVVDVVVKGLSNCCYGRSEQEVRQPVRIWRACSSLPSFSQAMKSRAGKQFK